MTRWGRTGDEGWTDLVPALRPLAADEGWTDLVPALRPLAADGGWTELLSEPWPVAAVVAGLAALLTIAVTVQRRRRRRRGELFVHLLDALEILLVTPTTVAGGAAGDPDRAEEVHQAGTEVRDALVELGRISRFETSAAASALLDHSAELADTLEARLHGERDPHLLDVRITELRERVRGDRDRLDAAIGA